MRKQVIDLDRVQATLYRDIEQHNRIAFKSGACAVTEQLSHDAITTMEFLNCIGIRGSVLYDSQISRFRGVAIEGWYERVPLCLGGETG